MYPFPVSLQRPDAAAQLHGSAAYPNLSGLVQFWQMPRGVLVRAELRGLPQEDAPCGGRFFGFHIHTSGDCQPMEGDAFTDTMGHFDPNGCLHPQHAGDLPPLLSCHGRAYLMVLTDRFRVSQVLGRAVIVHENPDDFTTQPSGNSGARIACGVIHRVM